MLKTIYLPAYEALQRRIANEAKLAIELEEWHHAYEKAGRGVRFGTSES